MKTVTLILPLEAAADIIPSNISGVTSGAITGVIAGVLEKVKNSHRLSYDHSMLEY